MVWQDGTAGSGAYTLVLAKRMTRYYRYALAFDSVMGGGMTKRSEMSSGAARVRVPSTLWDSAWANRKKGGGRGRIWQMKAESLEPCR